MYGTFNRVYRVRTKNYEHGHEYIFGLSVVLEWTVENLALFYIVTNCIKNQSYQSMIMIKVAPPLYFFQRKRNSEGFG